MDLNRVLSVLLAFAFLLVAVTSGCRKERYEFKDGQFRVWGYALGSLSRGSAQLMCRASAEAEAIKTRKAFVSNTYEEWRAISKNFDMDADERLFAEMLHESFAKAPLRLVRDTSVPMTLDKKGWRAAYIIQGGVKQGIDDGLNQFLNDTQIRKEFQEERLREQLRSFQRHLESKKEDVTER